MGIDAIDAIDAIDTIEEGIEGDFLNRGSVSCQNNRPSEAHRFDFAISKLRFRLRLSLAWSFSQYAISDGGISGYRGHLYKFFCGGEMFLCLRWGKKIRRGATFVVFVLWRKRMGRLRFLVCGEAMLNFYF